MSMLGMLSQIYCLVKAGEIVYRIRVQYLFDKVSKDDQAIGNFFFAEMLIFTNIVFSNILFLFFRAIFKHKVYPEVYLERRKQL